MVATVSLVPCLLIHVLIFAWYVFTLNCNCSLSVTGRDPRKNTYGGKWKYLTFLNLVLQTVFFGMCVLTDVVNLIFPVKSLRGGVSSLLATLRDHIFTMFAFPYGTFVFSSFWSLYAIDRELVYPKYLDDIIDAWLNHAMHTIILPLLFVQMYIQNHKYCSRVKGFTVLFFSNALYMSWILWVHHVADVWVYPILAKLSPTSVALFFGASAVLFYLLYLLGEKINGIIWGNTGPQKKMH